MNTKFDKNNNQNVNANKDMVNHPSHYQSESGLEVIDVIKAFTSNLTGIEATDTGNVLKYMCRWKNKNGVEDLKKAKWYLEHLIDNVENRISYSKYYDDNRNIVRDSRAKSGFRSDDIIFDNRGEAEIVLSKMDEIIDTYGIVTIADFYDLAGVTGDYTTNNYGWTNIRNAEVVRVRDGYIIKMPKAMPIDNVENRIEEKDESDLIKAINDLLMEDSYNDPYGIYFVDIDIF